MKNINMSESLKTLLNRAKRIGNATTEFATVEQFVVAACEAALRNPASGVDENVQKNLAHRFILHRLSYSGVLDQLLGFFYSQAEYSDADKHMDELYMQEKMDRAKVLVKQNGGTELTPEVLLDCILDEPTEKFLSLLTPLSRKRLLNPNPTIVTTTDWSESAQDERDSAGNSRNEICKNEETTSFGEGDFKEKETVPPKKAVADLTVQVQEIREALRAEVFGQENAINIFTEGYFQGELAAMIARKRSKPRATFLFAGPPGVGKTFLAEKTAEQLGLPYCRFDMSSYCDKEASLEFIGTDKAYKNSKEGNVTGFVSRHPKCVLLFDEIEKAHINIIHLFLQMLDAGRLRDSYTDQDVSFRDAIIILTTNAGKQLYENAEDSDFSALSRKVILNSLRDDINPVTGAPFFPAAICSRFASGNVVMFNHIRTHLLLKIAEKEITRRAEEWKEKFGIKFQIDKSVYTALLLANGGKADARTISNRAAAFFDNEMFELLRLMPSGTPGGFETVEEVHFGIQLSEQNADLCSLFRTEKPAKFLLFASADTVSLCGRKNDRYETVFAQTIEEAKKALKNTDFRAILIDISYGRKEGVSKYLNIEDVDSMARDFFRYLKEKQIDVPVYLLQKPGAAVKKEERVSFMRAGIRDVIALEEPIEGAKNDPFEELVEQLHQQNSMNRLARANKVVAFETAQFVSDDGKIAEIRLLDFSMSTAVDAEDAGSVLANISKPNVRFDQVIGAEDAKKELRFFTDYLKNPKKFLETGIRPPKGILLYGPPGTGKTMLAKAMAHESDVTFLSADGAQFLKRFVGEGKDHVVKLFKTARKYAPSILFIDEIDAIAKERRGADSANGGEDVLNAFLTEMDGFKTDPSKPVFVLAATNFDVEPGSAKSLDPALMRRFDRKIFVDLPNKEERGTFIRQKLGSNPIFAISEELVGNLAIRSVGMSLADLDSVLELALRAAIRDNTEKVTDEMLEDALEEFRDGEKKQWDLALLERVARHEAGHAYLCWKSGETPSYLTIVARGNHGGYMQHDDREGKAIYTKDELLSKVRISLGGRAAEIVYYGEQDGITSGVSGDLVSATNLARQIICTYGMDEKFGLAVVELESAENGELSDEVRTEVNEILSEQLKQAIELIQNGKPAIDALVAELMEKSHLTGKEIENVLRKNRIPKK